MIDFKNHKTAIFGIQGSGKSFLARKIVKEQFKKPFVYRVNGDFDNESVFLYRPKNVVDEIDFFFEKAVELAKEGKIDVAVVDEADMFFQSGVHLKEHVNDAVINHRHYNLAIVFISRRPQDIPTKITESCKVIIVFKLEGANALQKFKEIHPDFPALIERLDYAKHDFVIKEIGQPPKLHEPI